MKKTLLVLALLAGFSTTAYAAPALERATIDLVYVDDGNYGFNPDMTGFKIAGRLALGDSWYARGYYSSLDGNYENAFIGYGYDLNLKNYQIGLGYYGAISEKTSWNTDVSYISGEQKFASFGLGYPPVKTKGTGFRLAAGITHSFSEKIQANIGVNYYQLDKTLGFGLGNAKDLSAVVSGSYSFAKHFSLIGEYESKANDSGMSSGAFRVGVRASF